ncbi:hypothetical protein C8J38_1238 [Rhizobium sp. PP-WC-2G-219]|nr:hypothetical protein C8J38_1238 [Rhizobium sp. PP-WC-2G-219]
MEYTFNDHMKSAIESETRRQVDEIHRRQTLLIAYMKNVPPQKVLPNDGYTAWKALSNGHRKCRLPATRITANDDEARLSTAGCIHRCLASTVLLFNYCVF